MICLGAVPIEWVKLKCFNFENEFISTKSIMTNKQNFIGHMTGLSSKCLLIFYAGIQCLGIINVEQK